MKRFCSILRKFGSVYGDCRPLLQLLPVGLLFLIMTISAAGKESLANKKNAFALAYDIAAPSVVSIRGEKKFEVSEVRRDAYKGKAVENSKQESVTGMGSGIIMDERGYVITNYHVVKGLQNIQITTLDGTPYHNVEFVSYDLETDLALLKISSDKPFKPIVFGKSERVYVCEDVLAIGNPFGYSGAAARGIVSGLDRPLTSSETVSYERTIQTDTPINPGNSGGPLVNLDGEMIGMNAAVRDDAQNIAFAIPVDIVASVTDKMIRNSAAKTVRHGLTLEEIVVPTKDSPLGESDTDCVKVTAVQTGSPADAAGLKTGDILIESNGLPVRNSLDFTRSLIGVKLTDQICIKVERDGEKLERQVAMSGRSPAKTERKTLFASKPAETHTETVSTVLTRETEPVFQEADSAPSYSQNAAGSSLTREAKTKAETVYSVLGFEADPIGKEEFLRRYPNLTQVSIDSYKIMPTGGAVVTRVSDTTLFKTEKSGIQVGDVLFGFVVEDSKNSRWAITSTDILYVIARKWDEFCSESGNAKIYLVRDGIPYFLDIPLTQAEW